jgi:TP901 family phage tail tape measure protein
MATSKKFSIEAIFAAKDRLSATVGKIRGKLTGLGTAGGKALRSLDGAVNKSFGAVSKLSGALGIASVVSLGAFAYEMQNVMEHGAELEKTLIRTGSAFEKPVRVGTKGFEKLNEAARNVGATTEFSAQQGAESLNSLATAGYTLEQSIAALPKVIDFASAATLELGAASDITSDTLGAFNLRTADATKNAAAMGRVMDALTRTAADSTTNVTELFEGIRAGGAFAATAGASLEQFAALQGVLANKGFKGAEAGTAIRNSYLHLTKQTKEARDMQASLGVVTAKNKDGSIDLMTTVGRFTKATAKLTRAKKAEAIATIFGAYTVGPFLALMDAGEGTIRKFADNLEHATGVTQEMAGAMREGKAAKIARFFNILENVRLTVFEAIAPAVLQVADGVGKWVTANEKLIGTKAAEWATTLKDNLPEIWTWTVRIAKGFAGFAAAALAIKTLTLAVEGYEAVTKIAGGVAWLWKAAVDAGTFAAIRQTVATGALKVAQLASRAATLIMTAAQLAYTGQLNLSTLASVRFKIAEMAARVVQLASRAATVVATVAQGAYTIALATTTGGLAGFKAATLATVPAIGAQVVALAPLLITLGAVAAAVAGVVLAYKQLTALSDELAGSGGIFGTIGKMWEMGTFDPFEAHDAVMNEKAREERDERDRRGERELERTQMISPQARAAAANVDAAAAAGGTATVGGTITVEAKPGTKATAKTRPKSPPIVVKPSGAFAS